ncbi:Endonuclease III [subsurface metagenome]
MEQTEKVIQVTHILEREYKSPRHFNKRNPLNELLFIVLSLRTDERIYNKVYKAFKQKYPKWSQVYVDTVANIARSIYCGGLAMQKAERIKGVLSKIMQDFGGLSLKYIKSYDDEEMERYLVSLPGVGLKTARCIMMYSFEREVLPVDTHTYRISQRLGLVNISIPEHKVHKLMDRIIPRDLRYSYHVNCVAHGRAICKSISPNCDLCIINDFCDYHCESRREELIPVLPHRNIE